MNEEEIRDRVASFPRWHYEFDLKGVITPLADDPGRSRDEHRNRLEQRRGYFFTPLVEVMGGSLEGKRVLDLGCNAGFWSLEAIRAGAAFVYGIDGRQMHIDQANLVFEALDVERDRYEFALGDVLTDDLTALGSFDVVLCLGLLYHVAKPIELFDNLASVSSDVVVIDTGVSSGSGNSLELRRDDLSDPRSGIVHELVMFPTCRAVVYLLRSYGYKVVPLEPRITDYRGMPDYATGGRFAFIAAKRTDVSTLRAARIDPFFNGSSRLGRAAQGLRSVAFACQNLARAGVQNRVPVVHDLLSSNRQRIRRIVFRR
jgi:tRNA (mo5U34)-methyltransferase